MSKYKTEKMIQRMAEDDSYHAVGDKAKFIKYWSQLIAKNMSEALENNKAQYNKDLKLSKAELVEFAERVATNGRIKLRAKTKAELAAFLTLFDLDKTLRDPSCTPGPTDPNCKCAICEALRKRNAVPFSIYDDVEDAPGFPF